MRQGFFFSELNLYVTHTLGIRDYCVLLLPPTLSFRCCCCKCVCVCANHRALSEKENATQRLIIQSSLDKEKDVVWCRLRCVPKCKRHGVWHR